MQRGFLSWTLDVECFWLLCPVAADVRRLEFHSHFIGFEMETPHVGCYEEFDVASAFHRLAVSPSLYLGVLGGLAVNEIPVSSVSICG